MKSIDQNSVTIRRSASHNDVTMRFKDGTMEHIELNKLSSGDVSKVARRVSNFAGIVK
jgi:hypothetical protein